MKDQIPPPHPLGLAPSTPHDVAGADAGKWVEGSEVGGGGTPYRTRVGRTLSVVVPVFNGAPSLPALCEQLGTVLPDLADKYEVVLVNDGSLDESWRAIRALAARYPWIRGADLMRNYGQHNAILCGIRNSRYDVIVTMDDDLQHPPQEIRVLLDALGAEHDVVYGSPREQQHGLLRDLASSITKWVLQAAMGAETASRVSAFRALRREVLPAFESYQSSFVSLDVLLTWGTRRFASVAVDHRPRKFGVSNYTVTKLIRHALNMVTGFTTAPLQLASLIGFAFTLFGVAVLAFVLGRYVIDGGSIAGFPFLASVIAIFAGAQLFSLGVIGEYIARIHARSMGHPTYVLRDSVKFAPGREDDGAA